MRVTHVSKNGYTKKKKRKIKMNDSIVILQYYPADKGNIVGFFDIEVVKWGAIINGLAHVRIDKKEWINLPTKRDDSSGKPIYIPVIDFKQKPHLDEFKKIILKELKLFL